MAIVNFSLTDAVYSIRLPNAGDFTNLGTSEGGSNLTWDTSDGSRAVGVASDLVVDGSGVPTAGTFSSIRFDLGTPGLYNNVVITGLALSATDLIYSASAAATERLWNEVMAGASEIRLSATFAAIIAGDGITASGPVAGNDVFTGQGADNTTLTGDYAIVESVVLTGGDDTFNMTADIVDGDVNQLRDGTLTGGNDTIVYIADWTQDATVSVSGDAYFVTNSSVNGGDDLIDLSAISSTSLDNLLYGDVFQLNTNSSLNGGNDTIIGSDAGDQIFGDAQNVSISDNLTGGDDSIDGGAGDDLIYGDAMSTGSNVLGGDDTLLGGFGDDTIFGGGGNDSILGGSGSDSIEGQDGNDTIDGGGANDTINSGNGDDRVTGNTGNDVIFSSFGDDFINSGSGNDTIDAGTGNDTLYGGDGRDRMVGRFSDDTLYGGSGRDNMFGGHGNDFLAGESDDDRIIGQIGNDTLFGGAGSDTISAGDGQDFINGNAGDDFLFGGGDADLFVFKGAFGTDRLLDFEVTGANDVLDLRDIDGIDSYQDLVDNHMREIGNLVQITDFAGNRVLVFDVTLTEMSDSDLFLV